VRKPILVVGKEDGTVAAVLARFGEGAVEALAEGRIFVGKRRARADDPVRSGDEVWMYPARPAALEPPRILHEERGIVAVYKPPEMATVADHGGALASLDATVARMMGRSAPLHATSRLDVGVSGVVLFAADEHAQRRLARAREEGRYRRHYLAVGTKTPTPERGLWTGTIGRARDPRLRQVGGRTPAPAATAYATAAVAPQGALLAVEPQTGRTHQIRVHAAHAGCPLWGDGAYGGPTRVIAANGAVAEMPRIALHAAWVEITWESDAPLRVEAPLPPDFEAIWGAVGGGPSAFAAALAPIYVPP
jgi:23S rRNA-/tRNA-specific pseudouridylate synthase